MTKNETPLKHLLDLIVWVGLMLSVGSAQASRLALVIGNDQYEAVEKLHNARNDANLMAQTLRDAQFEVTTVQNVDRKRFFAELDQLQRRINKGDDVVFYFAGHGVQIGSNPVLLPVDVRASSDREVEREGVPLLDVQDALKDARVSLLVIDACRDNPFPKSGTRSVGGARGLAPPEAARGQAIIMSAGRGQKALDSVPGETSSNGLFTREFVQVLRQPGLEVRAALQQVRDRVEDKAARANHDQRPSLVDDLKGNFYLFGDAGAQVASLRPEPVPVKPQPEMMASAAPGQVFKDCDACPEMVVLPPGRFLMGSPRGEWGRDVSEDPQHEVSIAYRLAVGRFAVTFDDWQACVKGGGCRSNPNPKDGGWGRGRRPVINVSWNDAQQYVQWLKDQTGKGYRLLSEAEWEYAARAGTDTPFFTGRCINTSQASFVGKYDGDAEYNIECGVEKVKFPDQTQPVGSYPPNAFGLYDMAGNQLQWVEDVWHTNYNGAPTDGSAWVSAGIPTSRILRGGSWISVAKWLRSAYRMADNATYSADNVGFRIARIY